VGVDQLASATGESRDWGPPA